MLSERVRRAARVMNKETPKATSGDAVEETLSNLSERRDELGDLLRIGPSMLSAFCEPAAFDSDSMSSFSTVSMASLEGMEAGATISNRPSTLVLMIGLGSLFFLVVLVFVSIAMATKWFTRSL